MDDIPAPPPATIAYAELVEDHLEAIFKCMVLLLGDRDPAEEQTVAAFQRIWGDLNRGNVFGDAVEILYRAAVRGALGRLRRARELRGHLPATTADDRLITATGIIGDFDPQQKAAILLSMLCGSGYELAGIATGVGNARARDLAFAARQEYRSARGGAADTSPTCATVAPLLSGRADGEATAEDEARIAEHLGMCPVCTQTAALYAELARLLSGMRLPQLSESFREEVRQIPQTRGRGQRAEGWRRLLNLATAPAILVVVLILGLFIFQWLGGGEPSVRTGGGRTSDILFARESGTEGLLILESGSGRVLGRLPVGAVSSDGRQSYSSTSACPAGGCRTTLTHTDTATFETIEVTRLPGRLRVVAVSLDPEGAGDRVYLADEEADWGRLLTYDVAARALIETLVGPPRVESPFRPLQARLSDDNRSLLTLGTVGGQAAVVRTDVRSMRVVATTAIGVVAEGGVEVVSADQGSRILAYETATGRLHELDSVAGRVVRTLDIAGRAAVDNAPPPGGANPEGSVAVGPGGILYAVVRTGGIAVVDLTRFETVRRLNADRDYNSVSVSSDGQQLYVVDRAASDRASAYFVLDATTGAQQLRRGDVRVAGALQVNRGE